MPQQTSSSVTMKDIADEARVSIAAVSLALSDSPEISDQTKQRIREICKRRRYVPRGRKTVIQNTMRRPAARQRFGYMHIGRGRSEDAQMSLLNTLIGLTGEYDFRLEVTHLPQGAQTPDFTRRVAEFTDELDGLLLSGLVDVPMLEAMPKKLDRMLLLGSVISEHHPIELPRMVYSIGPSHTEMGRIAGDLLIKRGHRRIALIGEVIYPNLHLSGLLAGYRLAMLDHGVMPDESLVAISGQYRSGGAFAVEQLFNLDDPPTAFLAADTRVADSFREAASAAGRSIDDPCIVVTGIVPTPKLQDHPKNYTIVTPDLEVFALSLIQHLMLPASTARTSGLVRIAVPCRIVNI